MREVLKWNEDHTTGKRTELKCLKPDNGLIGRATIQVFDEYGDLKNETFTENIIPNWVNQHHYYRDQFAYIKDGRIDSAVYRDLTTFSQIRLTDYTGDENPNGVAMRGNVVGWCPRTDQNSGNDKTRGVYNPAESINGTVTSDRYYHAKMVYDFGTSQACGTFQSIYWGKKTQDINTKGKLYFYIHSYLHPKVRLDYTLRNNYNGAIVKNVDNSWKEVLNISMVVNSEELPRLSPTPVKFYNSTHRVLSETGEKMAAVIENKVSTEAGQDAKNMTCTFDTVLYNAEGTEVKRISHDYFVLDTEARDLLGRQIYINDSVKIENNLINWDNGDMEISFIARSQYNQIPVYTNGTITSDTGVRSASYHGIYNIFTETWIRKPSLNSVESRKRANSVYSPHGKFTIDGVQVLIQGTGKGSLLYEMVDGEPDLLKSFSLKECMASEPYSNIGCYVEQYNLFLPGTDTDEAFVVTPYSAHTKLPAPITKTNKDTMKITYDYYIQIPYNFSSTGDYLTPPPSEG